MGARTAFPNSLRLWTSALFSNIIYVIAMTNIQEEAIRAVSAAICAADGGLLSCIDSAQEKWQQELNSSKDTARTMLANVLQQRESLRMSLSTAAQLWRVLKPHNVASLISSRPKLSKSLSQTNRILATDEQMYLVKALQNVSHTILLMEFILSAPHALQRAHSYLITIKEDGFKEVHVGNAALLVEAHAILTAVERLRDVVRLESPHTLQKNSSPSDCFESASDTRSLLEDIVMNGVFANVIPISQTNPRLLVGAARIVEAEEAEDAWWAAHLQRCAHAHLGPQVRPYGALRYKKRSLDAIIESLQSVFKKKEKALGLLDGHGAVTPALSSNRDSDPSMEVLNILDWIEHRRLENETVRRFVMPCVPASFAVADIYEKELHRQFMQLVTRLLHLGHPDGSMFLSEADLIQLTTWYSKYKDEAGDQDESIDSFLGEADRKRLILALQRHCANRITAQVKASLATDRKMEGALTGMASSAFSRISEKGRERGLRRTDLPDIVLGCVNEHVKRMLSLKVQGLDQAIAQTVAECLSNFQREVRVAIAEERKRTTDDEYGLYICATANNMARCLEYSEDLRDLFIPLALDQNRSDIENKMDSVIEGFRMTASMALQALITGMTVNLSTHAIRFYAPHTGTEIMLDVIATLEDYFSDFEMHLLPYHFEHLAIESLKRVVVWYLGPFLRLSEQQNEDSVARRFTSLPTFEEVSLTSGNIIAEDDPERDVLSRRSENDRGERRLSRGLSTMNADAVVAQIEKDLSNLQRFMRRKVVLYQKKQLGPAIEPMQAIRSLYTCPSTAFGLSDAYREARAVIVRALRPSWTAECRVDTSLTARVAEVIWESRKDISPVILLEAVTMIRTGGDRIETGSPSHMFSADDGRAVGMRYSEGLGERMTTREAASLEHSGSSSLLWAPSPKSRSKRGYS